MTDTEELWKAHYDGVEDLGDLLAMSKTLDPDGKTHLRCLTGDRTATLHDNNMRAAWATVALEPYVKRTFGDSNEDFETMIGDLISDLMHLCDAVGLDPYEIVDKGGRFYEQEVRGDV